MSSTKKTSDFGKFDFVGKVGLFGGISVVMVLASLIYLAVHGVSYGIDFAGGTEVQVKFGKNISIDQVRAVAEKQGLKDVGIQSFPGESSEYVIRFRTPPGTTEKEANELQNQVVAKVRDSIQTDLASFQPEIRRIDSVGPQVGAELKRNGYLAIFYSLLVILAYVALRFDPKYSPGAVICLAHDVIITLAIFVLTGREVNVPVLAALLTLVGYSLNDTIVVYDRIRETENMYADRGMKYVINKAINEMLGRTMITAATTTVSALTLYLFSDGTVSDISFAMLIGMVFGTYSSVYVAAPFILFVEKFKKLRTATAS